MQEGPTKHKVEILSLSRDTVLADYASAKNRNRRNYLKGDVHASEEYIYQNQKEDSADIVHQFYQNNLRVVSVVKRTKVGMDGLMIQLLHDMTTHPDDDFCVPYENAFILTGMSNITWEEDMKKKIPACFANNIHHHGKLKHAELLNLKNALIIVDEIDTGDKEDQILHTVLKESGILNLQYMIENNIRFVFVSATMLNQLSVLYKWGAYHANHLMRIPASYIGHKEFLEQGIIQEYYPVDTDTSADRWISEDILAKYGNEPRIHFIRTNKKCSHYVQNACIRAGILFRDHTSTDRISREELTAIFDNVSRHMVIAIKGFYRRANLIPNAWKLKIGAVHERYTIKFDEDVQVQGLPGRLTGHWRTIIESGHVLGPIRTSIPAIEAYERFMADPVGVSRHVSSDVNSFIHPKHVMGLPCLPSKKELRKSCMRVPTVVPLTAQECSLILQEKNAQRRITLFLEHISRLPAYAELYAFIGRADVKNVQVTVPGRDFVQGDEVPTSIKKQILDLVKASEDGRTYSVSLKLQHQSIPNWQLFIDNGKVTGQMRACITTWDPISRNN